MCVHVRVLANSCECEQTRIDLGCQSSGAFQLEMGSLTSVNVAEQTALAPVSPPAALWLQACDTCLAFLMEVQFRFLCLHGKRFTT